MNQTRIYVGLDVDDAQYHGAALNKRTGEVIDFKCRPTLKGLLGQLEKLRKHFPGCSLRLCYEASYISYSLQRDLAEKGHHCDVVAPTSVGERLSTDCPHGVRPPIPGSAEPWICLLKCRCQSAHLREILRHCE
jgi:hypothetical protein